MEAGKKIQLTNHVQHSQKKKEWEEKAFQISCYCIYHTCPISIKKKKKANPNSMKIQNYKHSSILNGCFEVQYSES